jgi:hypothetical protein
MKIIISTLGLFFSLSFSLSAPAMASSGTPILFEGVDISPMVDFLAPRVVTLEKPVVIYNWSQDGANGDAWAQGKAQLWSQTFWRSFGSIEGAGNMYGAGLYGAVDPVATVDYGGRNGHWLLLEMKLPVGFKMIDVNDFYSFYSYRLTPPVEYVALATQMECPTDGYLSQFFETGGYRLKEKCRRLLQKIFKDIFQIDGFIYEYTQTPFKECKQNYLQDRAFVITDSKWMKPELIHYYTAKTVQDLDSRVRIQTLFLKVNSNGNLVSTDSDLAAIADYLTNHPDSELSGSTTLCNGSTCTITVKFCDKHDQCINVDLPPLPRPFGGVITEDESQRTIHRSLLWPDLEGKPKAATISTWLKDNKFACSGELPYQPYNPNKK